MNTHEHQRQFSDFEGIKPNFYFLLSYSYLRSDVVSAGGDPLEIERINNLNLDELWNLYGKYLNFCRNTSYYSQFLKGFQALYDFNDNYFTGYRYRRTEPESQIKGIKFVVVQQAEERSGKNQQDYN